MDQTPVSYETELWLSCNLLHASETQGARKFAVYCGDVGQKAIKLWIFAPYMEIASSAYERLEPVRVCKILWQEMQAPPEHGRLNAQSLAEGEIGLPSSEMDRLRQVLEQSSRVLPESAREFQEWRVGLLRRFAVEETQA